MDSHRCGIGTVTMSTKCATHRQRLAWLREHGFDSDERGHDLNQLGFSVLVEGVRDGQHEQFWLSVKEGNAEVHYETSPVKSWEELQAWIQEKPPEAKKPLAAQRNLFGDDE